MLDIEESEDNRLDGWWKLPSLRIQVLLVLGTVSVLFITACHKSTPIAAAQPTRPVPVVVPPPQPAPESKPVAVRTAPTPVAPKPPSRAAMPPEVRATLNDRLSRLEDALFDFDRYVIRADATAALREDVGVIRDILQAYPDQKLLIEGHADERGSAEYNLALGDKRARATEEFLSNMGISKGQLTVISYGKDRPVCSEPVESCWQKNRRAHITAAR